MQIDKKILKKIFFDMNLIRIFEENALLLAKQKKVIGSVYSYIGEEAVAAGACNAIRKDDYVLSTHRSVGHALAKGLDPGKIMAELFGRIGGYCKGVGGGMHIFGISEGFLGSNGIVGAGEPIATGAAYNKKMEGKGGVVLCFFGDGASNTGAFHEGLNLAATWNLPVIFICENNLFAQTTPQHVHQKIKDISKRAIGFDMPGVTIDGNDVIEVFDTVTKMVKRAREDGGPSLIECKTYRWFGHWDADPEPYRTREEVEEWKKKGPIKRYRKYLLDNKIFSENELDEEVEKIKSIVKEAIDFADSSPEPPLDFIYENTYTN